MFCSKCGNQVNPGDNVCTRCGAPVGGNSDIQGNMSYNQTPDNPNMNYNANPNMNPNMNYNANPNMNRNMNYAGGNNIGILKIVGWLLVALAVFYIISFFCMSHIAHGNYSMNLFEVIEESDGEYGVFSLLACLAGSCIGLFFGAKGVMQLMINDNSTACRKLAYAFVGLGGAKIIQLIDSWIIAGQMEVDVSMTPVSSIILSILAVVVVIAAPILADEFY